FVVGDGYAVGGVAVDAGLAGDEDFVEHGGDRVVGGGFVAVAVQELDVGELGEPHGVGVQRAVVGVEGGFHRVDDDGFDGGDGGAEQDRGVGHRGDLVEGVLLADDHDERFH